MRGGEHFLEAPPRIPAEDARNIRAAAFRLARTSPSLVQYTDDLIAAGYSGALKAIERDGDNARVYLAGYRDMIDRMRELGLVSRHAFAGEHAYKAARLVSAMPLDEVEFMLELRDRAFEDVGHRDLIEVLLRCLPSRDRALVRMYYLEGATFLECATTLGVTESRACQIHARALVMLGAAARRHGSPELGR